MEYMNIELKDKGELVFYAADDSKAKGFVFIYRITALDRAFGEENCSDLYVAVPNGKNIFVKDLPKGRYVLEKVGQK